MNEEVSKALFSSLEKIGQEENLPLAKTLVKKGKTIFSLSYDHLKEPERKMISLGFFIAAAETLSLDTMKEKINLFIITKFLGEKKSSQLAGEITKFSDLIINMVEENNLRDAMIPICLSLAFELEVHYG